MWKRLLTLSLVFAMLLTIPAYAATPRRPNIWPTISFEGTTAECSLIVSGDLPTDEINATLELRQGDKLIDSWEGSQSNRLNIKGSATVTKGKTYRLIAKVKINDKTYSPVEISGTCE